VVLEGPENSAAMTRTVFRISLSVGRRLCNWLFYVGAINGRFDINQLFYCLSFWTVIQSCLSKDLAHRPVCRIERWEAMKLPRVILADDHTLVAEALCGLVSQQFNVIATVADGHALVAAATALKPDVIVVDIAMPLLNGLEAFRQLKQKMPGVKFIFLTMNEDPELAVEAMRCGASGYVLKKSAASELLKAMQWALRGKPYITPQIARGMQESFIRNPQGTSHAKSLTARQREVVQLLAEGKSMKEVADVLKVATRTVAFHKYRVMQDLGFKTNADLIQFAVKNRIVVG